MSRFGTQFTETEALLHAMEDEDVDSGNSELTEAYLRENFLPGELRRLQQGALHLSYLAGEVLRDRTWEPKV